MKKLLITTIGLITFLNFTALSFADYTVIPAPPYERQFNIEVDPGSKQSASILIKNLGSSAITLNLYGADATQSAQGTFALTTKSGEQRHIGNWIKFEKTNITVPAREEITIPFVIEVPATATPGSYAGGLAVEKMGEEGNLSEMQEASSVSISSRFIVRIYLLIPGEINHSYQWNDFRYNYSDEQNHAKFTFEISNNGNTILMVDPKVELVGFPPLKEPVIELPTATIQPGTQSQTIDLRLTKNPPFGFYFATATATFSELDIIKNEKINPIPEYKQLMINLTPWYFIAIILFVIFALIFGPIIYYLKAKFFLKKCVSYTVVENDTIINLAETNNANWKKIAKINKLKAPYTLKIGQKLLIPPKKK